MVQVCYVSDISESTRKCRVIRILEFGKYEIQSMLEMTSVHGTPYIAYGKPTIVSRIYNTHEEE